MNRPSARTKWLVTLAAPLAAVLALELGLRLAGFEHRAAHSPLIVWETEKDAELDQAAALHRLDLACLWAPRPGALVRGGDAERINAASLRGPELAAARDPGVLRIALIGESSLFGMHLSWAQTCAPRLEAALAERGVRAEVLNAAVIGHTVRQGLERYRSTVRPLRPDVVFVAFGAQNEAAPCESVTDAEKLAQARVQLDVAGEPWLDSASSSRVLQLAQWIRDRERTPELDRLRRANAGSDDDLDVVGQVEWPGCRRVPLDDFESALDELAAAVRADGALLILGSLPRLPELERRRPVLALYSERVERAARRWEAPLIDLRGRVCDAAAAGLDARSFFTRDRWHLGPAGQALLADLLADALRPARP